MNVTPPATAVLCQVLSPGQWSDLTTISDLKAERHASYPCLPNWLQVADPSTSYLLIIEVVSNDSDVEICSYVNIPQQTDSVDWIDSALAEIDSKVLEAFAYQGRRSA